MFYLNTILFGYSVVLISQILEILTSTSSNSDQLSALFIGHHLNHKGYKRLDPRKVIISQNVVFDEFFFPFAKKSNCTDQQTSASQEFLYPQAEIPIITYRSLLSISFCIESFWTSYYQFNDIKVLTPLFICSTNWDISSAN